MSERTEYPNGVPCWVAAVELDPRQAAEFYTQLFGWEVTELMSPAHPAHYLMCTLSGRKVAAIVSVDGAPAPPQPLWATHVSVDDADETIPRIEQAGGSLIGPPFESPAGGRMAVVADSHGIGFCLWQPGEHHGAQLVNEAGAWAMSSLHTPAPQASTRFYGTVFGWQPEPFGDATLFRLPGYVGGEPGQPVPRDVVAVMTQTTDGVPPHWNVNFWVADTDGTAAKAAQLGGSVLVAPFDSPGFRNAVVADPQGAAFSISKLVYQ
jgi:uncharacterized protein